MGATAIPSRIEQKWQYKVRVQGLEIGHFTSCSGLEGEVEMTEYHAGGDPDPALQTPAKRKHAPVTLGAGASEVTDLWDMWNRIYNAEGAGESLDDLRVQVFIDVLDRDGETVLKTHVLNRAIMSKFKAGEFDGSSSDNVIEEVTFHYKNLSRG